MQPTWMDHAWAHFGVREARGDATNGVIAEMYRDAGHPTIKDDAVPWCAAFVGACLKRAGHDPTGSLMARSYLEWGVALDAPVYGALAVFSRGAGPTAGHVAFVVGETDDALFVLGGNQSDTVSVARYPRARLLGLRGARGAPSAAGSVAAGDGSAFDPCLRHVLEMEGGYTNDPVDPGGPTNKGVTLATWAHFRGVALADANRERLIAELREISDADVRAIYRSRYWSPSRASEMPPGIDLIHFDASVNHGLHGGAELIQQAVGVTVDGEIGPVTMAAIMQADSARTIERHAAFRERRYRRLPHFWRFGRGWLRRTAVTRQAGLSRLAGAARSPAQGSTAEPNVSDVAPKEIPVTHTARIPNTKPWTQSLTMWGTLITTLSTVLPIIGPFFGLQLSADMIQQIGDQTLNVLQAIGGLAGVVMTVTGRLRATTQLTR